MAVRRFFASKKLKNNHNTWPISFTASKKPMNWPGWPKEKKFCVALSHDVETKCGYRNIEALTTIEEELGFRSVINFIPEGEYKVDEELVCDLQSRGFEVGVHGLHHDGKLYNRRKIFAERAKRINYYLQKWGASGFRSPLMHHNLEWIHDLSILYDSSTFDSDPFEPQPDGVNTIYPFWVPNKNLKAENAGISRRLSRETPSLRNGYVEIPYTLPQDSTLFLLLKEKTNNIWKKKLAWIAENQGMAFVNVHPDYMDFDGNRSSYTYPIALYSEFLEHIKSTYDNLYWHAKPAEIATNYLLSSSNLRTGEATNFHKERTVS